MLPRQKDDFKFLRGDKEEKSFEVWYALSTPFAGDSNVCLFLAASPPHALNFLTDSLYSHNPKVWDWISEESIKVVPTFFHFYQYPVWVTQLRVHFLQRMAQKLSIF